MTDNYTALIVGVTVVASFYIAFGSGENITDQQYKSISLQYLEDIRNELEVLNETNYENYILNN